VMNPTTKFQLRIFGVTQKARSSDRAFFVAARMTGTPSRLASITEGPGAQPGPGGL
jgi:hypothetical protein